MRGILIIDKPEGQTSFEALGPLKRMLGTKKIGHSGTLDRFASGLMIALVGPYSRLNQWFSGLDKTYHTRFVFGKETDTLDPEGRIVAEGPLPSENAIRDVLGRFLGKQQQMPPDFSAIHVQGKRAYQRKLAGEIFALPSREIRIDSLDFISYSEGELEFRVVCSKGTYIRSLARDLAEALGTKAYVRTLRRERVGPFCVKDASKPSAIDPSMPRELLPNEATELGLEPVALSAKGVIEVGHGRALSHDCFLSEPSKRKELALYHGAILRAIASIHEKGTRYSCVLGES